MRRTHALILVVVALASSGATASDRSARANPVEPLIIDTAENAPAEGRSERVRAQPVNEGFAPAEPMGPPMPVGERDAPAVGPVSTGASERGIEPEEPGRASPQEDAAQAALPLGLPRGVSRAGADTGATIQSGASSAWILRTAGSLTLVVGLVIGCRAAMQWLEKRTGGGSGFAVTAGAPSGLVQVLARYPVAKGTKLLLLKINARILVVAQTSDGLQTLSEIVDPEEVASILIKTRDEEGASEASRFTDLLREMEADPAVAGAAGDFRSPRRAMASSGAEIEEVESVREPVDGASALRNRLSSLGDLSA